MGRFAMVRQLPCESRVVLSAKEPVHTPCVAGRRHECFSETPKVSVELARRDSRGRVDAEAEALQSICESAVPRHMNELPPVESPRSCRGYPPHKRPGVFALRGRNRVLGNCGQFIFPTRKRRRIDWLILELLERGKHRWNSLDEELNEPFGPI